MIEARFLSNQTGVGWHTVTDIWDLRLDPVEVCGVEFWEQTARTCSFSCLRDDWLNQYVLSDALLTYAHKGYLRLFFRLYEDNQLIFSGYLKANAIEQSFIHPRSRLYELTFTFVNALALLKDMAEGMTKTLTANQVFNAISELQASLNSIPSGNTPFFNAFPGAGLVAMESPSISTIYDEDQWQPFHVEDIELFDRRAYDWPANVGDGTALEHLEIMKLEPTAAGDAGLTYIDYHSRFYYFPASWPRRYFFWEYLKYGLYTARGLNLERTYPGTTQGQEPGLIPLSQTRLVEAYFDSDAHLTTSQGEGVQQVDMIQINGNEGFVAFSLSIDVPCPLADLGIPHLVQGDTIQDIYMGATATYYDGYGWYSDGDTLTAILPGHAYWYQSFYTENYEWAFIDPNSHTEIGLTVEEWLARCPHLLQTYGVDAHPGPTHLEIPGITTNYYSILDGILFFSGFDTLTTIRISEDTEINLLDWIKTLLQIKGAWLLQEAGYNALWIANKAALYNTSYTALPSEIIGTPKLTQNYFADSKFELDLSFLQSGAIIAASLNSYLSNLLRKDLRWLMELILDGRHEEVGLRYHYQNLMLYVIAADYGRENDQTAIKALTRMV